MQSPTSLSSWGRLNTQAKTISSIKSMFENPNRFDELHFNFKNLLFDFSKQRVNKKVMDNLFNLAEESDLEQNINDLFNGKKVNYTENKPALHTLCRDVNNDTLFNGSQTLKKDINNQLDKIEKIVHKIHNKHWRGYTGKAIKDIVHIGVGGSELGPLVAIQALEEHAVKDAVNINFISNLDGLQLLTLLKTLNSETTLFLVVSKTFTTLDTITNADTAKLWFLQATKYEYHMKHHFIGISSNEQKMQDWGIVAANQIQLWEWVGGRYSLWSAIGFTVALYIGMDKFRELLSGANQMDLHFKNTELRQNIPVIMGMIGIWNYNFLNINGHVILPYDNRLRSFPTYLEQLMMESNGKSANQLNRYANYETCPVVWGDSGTNAQHSFYQLLHQGTHKITCDFIVATERLQATDSEKQERADLHQNLKIANCLAQSRALAYGQNNSDIHKYYPGNQPSTTILLELLNPKTLGMLIAAYEHVVFVQASIWKINPFDQWGVEYGKSLSKEVYDAINQTTKQPQDTELNFDSSTTNLINKVIKIQAKKTS